MARWMLLVAPLFLAVPSSPVPISSPQQKGPQGPRKALEVPAAEFLPPPFLGDRRGDVFTQAPWAAANTDQLWSQPLALHQPLTSNTAKSTKYPKKWISPHGKKIRAKYIEKHSKAILSSTANVPLQPQWKVEEKQTLKTKRQQHQEPAQYKLPAEERIALPAQTTDAAPLEPVGHKPYAYNHQQDTSSTGLSPLFAAEETQHGFGGHGVGSSGDRVAFHIHGEKGPKSYRFGYDTGNGPDRQFRYEQRDDEGNVKGHYGFYDKHGKLQVVHYSADPKNGFSADGGNFGKHEVL